MSTPAQTVEYPDVIGVRPEEPTPVPFQPYIPASVKMRELTLVPIIVGTILGMIFGASSLYLVLKVGLTVSASIPVAVISITLFKILSQMGAREATILENNVVQTAGSAGESIAFGVGVTMPAILILGFDLQFTRVMLVAVLGGLLGILMMIPLRRALIVKQHGILKYPEGTACAEVLKAGASAESRAAASEAAREGAMPIAAPGARTIFTGFGIGVLYKTAMVAFKGWKDIPEKVFGAPLKAGSISAEVSPELLGVGYIIGPRIAAIMAAGGVLAYLVLIPAIKFFGESVTGVLAPGTKPISEMGPNDIRSAYVLYIGAGAVATAGIVSVIRSIPIILHALRAGVRDVRGVRSADETTPRTDRDLPMSFVGIGTLVLLIAIVLARPLHMNIFGALLIVIFGFLFVTVSSRLTGEIGSTSNPISGMTYATLLLTTLIFLTLGWTERAFYVTALSVGAVVCVAAANGGTTSQDLKTGFLVGATPRNQQIAILIGAFASALILGPILLRLNDNYTVYVPRFAFERAPGSVRIDPAALPSLPAIPAGTDVPSPGQWRLLRVGTGPSGYPGLAAGEYLVNETGTAIYKYDRNFPDMRVDTSKLTEKEKLQGPQARDDANSYFVWHNIAEGGYAGKYLVNDQGQVVYLVDPGINGTHRQRPDGSEVTKFDAPKAVLVSYIIKGILDRKLPWGLVLLGAMIALVLEMSGIPSLAFAVGVYLPLSTSAPIFVGGLIRWVVDRYLRRKYRGARLTEEQLIAETDKSPGVLMASGYIAGGAIAGIIIAFMAGVLVDVNRRLEEWAVANNPFFAGPNADLLALIPFVVLIVLLYLTGREIIMKPRTARSVSS